MSAFFLQIIFATLQWWIYLILCPQLYLWGSIFGWDFCVCDRFLIQPLRYSHSFFVDFACWMFLLPAFTGLWSFESVRWNACVHRLDHGLYSYPREFWGNGVLTHVNSKGKKKTSTGSPEEDRSHDTASGRAVSPTLYQLSYSAPPLTPPPPPQP